MFEPTSPKSPICVQHLAALVPRSFPISSLSREEESEFFLISSRDEARSRASFLRHVLYRGPNRAREKSRSENAGPDPGSEINGDLSFQYDWRADDCRKKIVALYNFESDIFASRLGRFFHGPFSCARNESGDF